MTRKIVVVVKSFASPNPASSSSLLPLNLKGINPKVAHCIISFRILISKMGCIFQVCLFDQLRTRPKMLHRHIDNMTTRVFFVSRFTSFPSGCESKRHWKFNVAGRVTVGLVPLLFCAKPGTAAGRGGLTSLRSIDFGMQSVRPVVDVLVLLSACYRTCNPGE